jgi:hypothetical protein
MDDAQSATTRSVTQRSELTAAFGVTPKLIVGGLLAISGVAITRPI